MRTEMDSRRQTLNDKPMLQTLCRWIGLCWLISLTGCLGLGALQGEPKASKNHATPKIYKLSAPSGYVGTSITVSGSEFGPEQKTSTLSFGGVPAATITWSRTKVVASVPQGATTGHVVVTVQGVASNAANFTVIPQVLSITPSSGPPGTSIKVSGTGFGNSQGSNVLKIGVAIASVNSWSATTISAAVPRTAKTAPVSITVNGVVGNGPSFSVGGPNINSLSSSADRVGVVVTIYGSNFGNVPDTVTFNGTAATTAIWWDTQVSAFVPQGATDGNIVVTVGGIPSNGMPFTVTGFNPTGSLNVGRNGHRAILLNDGTVLVVGGWSSLGGSSLGVEATAEVYNPQTATFTATGILNVARACDTITLLDDGTVLIVGGSDSSGNALSSAEIYDPSSGMFTTIPGSLAAPRLNHSATRLKDGTVLIAGGSDTAGNALSTAELYIPSTQTFITTGSLNVARYDATGTALNDGTVLLAGGVSGGNAIPDAEVYNATTQSFTVVGNLNSPRVRHTATLLNTGLVLIVGGTIASGIPLDTAELYDPATSTFSQTGSLFIRQADHAATLMTDGNVLVTGGFVCASSNCNTGITPASNWAVLYDPAAGTFSFAITSLNINRQAHTSTLLTDGTVLVAGGWGYNADLTLNRALPYVELYQPDPAALAPPNLVSISISPVSPTIPSGTSQTLVATGTFSDASTLTLASVIWSSSNTTVATVTNDAGSNSGVGNDSGNTGAVFGRTAGNVTVTACAGSICNSINITIAP